MPIIHSRLEAVSKMLKAEVPVPVIIETANIPTTVQFAELESFGTDIVGQADVLNFTFAIVLNKNIPELQKIGFIKSVYYDEPTYKLGGLKGPIPEARQFRPTRLMRQTMTQIQETIPQNVGEIVESDPEIYD
jgi:hypothetical protein